MQRDTTTLAQRLGITAPTSPLLMKVRRMARAEGMTQPQDWLRGVANRRGYRVIVPARPEAALLTDVPLEQLSNEELAVAILHPAGKDRPQLLRLAAQIISRGHMDIPRLLHLSRMECAARILRELSHQALKVEASHPVWSEIDWQLQGEQPLRDALIHWTRLAEPVPSKKFIACGWRLVA